MILCLVLVHFQKTMKTIASKEFKESDTVPCKKFKCSPCNYPASLKSEITASNASNDLTKKSNDVVISDSSLVSCCSFLQKNFEKPMLDNNLSPSFLKEPNQNDQNLLTDYPLNVTSKDLVKVNENIPKESNSCSDKANLNSFDCESVHKESTKKVQNISSKIDQEDKAKRKLTDEHDNAFSPNGPCSSTFIQEHSNNEHNKEPNPVSTLLSKSFQNDPELFNDEGTVLKIFPCIVDLSKNNVCFNNFLQKSSNELPEEQFPSLPEKVSTFDPSCIYRATWECVKRSTQSLPKKVSTFDSSCIYGLVRKIYVESKLNNIKCDWKKVYNTYFYSYYPFMDYDAFLELVKISISRHNMCIKMDNLRCRLKKITDKKEAEFRRKKKIYYDTFRCIFADVTDYDTQETCVQNVKVCKVELIDSFKQTHLFNEKDRSAITSCHNKSKTAEGIEVSPPAMDMGI